MTTPEGKIKTKIQEYLRRLRLSGDPLWFFKVHGGAMQMAGVPDLLVLYRGTLLAIEIKRPGEDATRLQKHTLTTMAAAGAAALVATSVEDVRQVIERIKTQATTDRVA
jgi:Holliday junction resolvase